MKLELYKHYNHGTKFITIITRSFLFRWFTECDYWFVYIELGNKFWRFSEVGYLSGEVEV